MTHLTSGSTLSRNAETKRRLKALRSLPASGEECQVPGCTEDKITEDCCYEHSLDDAHNALQGSLPNDGIIDWVAVDLAVQGVRPVRLTRVEKDIAIAKMLKTGRSPTAVADSLGVSHTSINDSGRRGREVARILKALPDPEPTKSILDELDTDEASDG